MAASQQCYHSYANINIILILNWSTSTTVMKQMIKDLGENSYITGPSAFDENKMSPVHKNKHYYTIKEVVQSFFK